MTLEEAIAHCEEVAQKKEQLLEIHRRALILTEQEQECIKCAEDHRQLAEWLKELQMLRKGDIVE